MPENRTERIAFMVTPSEMKRIAAQLKKHDLRLSTWVRDIVLDQAPIE